MKIFILTFLLMIFTMTEGMTQWTSNASDNTVISNAASDQATPKIATTSDGGCYITWFDNSVPNYSVYLQKLDRHGVPQFPNNGLLISNHTQNTFLQDFNIDVDANDNAVLVFTDLRNGSQLNPFAYLISPTGNFLWGANGISLTDSTTIVQNIPVVTTTSDGNFVFAWQYISGGNRIIAMQKLNSAGVKQWGSAPKKLRGTGAERWEYARLIKSNSGNVIMSWIVYLGNIVTTSSTKLFTQKFDVNGNGLWTAPQDTVQNIGRIYGLSYIPTLVSDGQDGAVYTWTDDRDVNTRSSVWVQRFNSTGAAQFPKNGTEATTLSTNQHYSPSTTYLPSTGETVTFWTETNGAQTVVGGLYGQKFDAAGNQQWGTSGKEFKAMDNNQLSFISALSNDTSVVVSYSESQFASANTLVKGLKTGPSSESLWSGNIITAASFLSSKVRRQSAMDNTSGMVTMVWSDNRSGSGDILAQNINLDGTLGQLTLDVTLGNEAMWNGASQVQDTVKFLIRNSTSPYAAVDSFSVFLDANGNGKVYFSAPAGNYFIQTSHRNALETWSGAGIAISNVISNFNFTTSASQSFGNNSVLTLGRYCSYSGEINKDGVIDISDVSLIDNDAFNFAAGYISTDVNGDNVADLTDLSVTSNNADNFVAVMKP
ncbi:MAG TPA: hypothetical protein PLD63_01240 [Ignavibacteria bacterium]|nr:hypothetical protein [Ignavibacteria bacterium]